MKVKTILTTVLAVLFLMSLSVGFSVADTKGMGNSKTFVDANGDGINDDRLTQMVMEFPMEKTPTIQAQKPEMVETPKALLTQMAMESTITHSMMTKTVSQTEKTRTTFNHKMVAVKSAVIWAKIHETPIEDSLMRTAMVSMI